MKKVRYYYSDPVFTVQAHINITKDGYRLKKFIGKVKHDSRVTICGILNESTNTLSFGMARCSSKDVFKKSIGRKLAYDRALNEPLVQVKVTKETISSTFIDTARMLEKHNSELCLM